jgi:molybdopterin converting factor small subunit
VKVEYSTLLKNAIGLGKEEYKLVEGELIEDLWIKILDKYGTDIEKAGYVDRVTKKPKSIIIAMTRIGVIGLKHIDLYEGLKTELRDGDSILIYPPIIGG